MFKSRIGKSAFVAVLALLGVGLACQIESMIGSATLGVGPACPAQGSGAAGVANWAAANCSGSCANPVVTCNGEFQIEMTGVNRNGALVTFNYRVCRQPGSPHGLSHWVLSLDQLLACLGSGKTLGDLVAGCAFNGVPDGGQCATGLGTDPTTQVNGQKWTPSNENTCNDYSVTFDESALASGSAIDVGCVVAATKAGNQDMRRADRATPGFACVPGPVCGTPSADQGCSAGFWKNHHSAWPLADGPLSNYFTFPASLSGLGSGLLSEALTYGGGPTLADAARLLLHQAAAALLNANDPNIAYPRTQAEIVADVNAALASENRDTILALKDGLDADNNLGCPH